MAGSFHARPAALHEHANKISSHAEQVGSVGAGTSGAGMHGRALGAVGAPLTGTQQGLVSRASSTLQQASQALHHQSDTMHNTGNAITGVDDEHASNFGKFHPTAQTAHLTGGSSGGVPKSGPSGSGGSTRSNRPHNPQDTSVPGKNKNCVTDPVDVATGDVVLIEQDLELPAPLPFALERTHISSYRAGRWFGSSWSATVDQRLELDDQGVCFLAPDGLVLVYPHPAPGSPVLPAAGPSWPLEIDQDGGYTVTLADRTLRFGTRSGARAEIVELDAITDAAGNRVDIDRDERHLPVLLRHSAGYRVALRTAEDRITELHVLGDPDVDVLVLRYGYDERGRLTEVVNSSGRPTRYSYDPVGRLAGWQDRNGTWFRYEYDADGRCVRTVGLRDFFNSTLHYDPDRRITTFTNSLGQTTVYQLNELRQTVRETDPLGHVTTFEWDRRNRLLSRTDPLGRTTRFEYAADGEVAAVVRADGSQVRIDSAGPFSISVYAGDRRWRRRYPARPDPLTTPLGVSETTTGVASLGGGNVVAAPETGAGGAGERDVFGRPVQAMDAAGRQARLGWTIEGKLAWRATPTAREQWRYDPEGNETGHTDAVGQATRTEYGPFDLRTATIDATGARTGYAYDTELRLVGVTNPNGQIWHYRYDPAGRLVESVDFDGRRQRYDYDAAGQLIRSVNAAGQVVEYGYDTVGNLVEQRTESGRIGYRYDPVGNLIAANGPDGELTIERDETGQVIAHTVGGRTTTFRYDEDGFWSRRRTPSGVDSEWRCGQRGAPESVTIAGHTISFGYDETGRELGHRVDDAVVLRRTIDENGLSSTDTVTVGSSEVADSWPVSMRRYGYRADDHLVSIDDGTDGAVRLQLDAAGRITGVTATNRAEHYGYDALGNLTASPAGPHEYQGNTLMSVGDTSYQHDAQGRLVRRSHGPRSWHYTWDSLDRMTGVLLPDGTRWQYRYDPLGRRIAKQHLDATGRQLEQVEFVWDGALLVEQIHTDATGTHVTTWAHHPVDGRPLAQLETTTAQQKPASGIHRFHTIVTDPLGTPVELLDANGASTWRSRTTIWGAPLPDHTGPPGTPLRFPGQYHDAETGLHYNVHRYYDPVTARYLSPDPLGLAPAPNPVAYVPNPLRLADPLGLMPGSCTVPSSSAPTNPGHSATPGLVGNTAPQYMSDHHFNTNHEINDPELMTAADNYVTTSAHPGATHKQKNDAAEAMGEVGAVSYLKAHTGNPNITLTHAHPNAPHNLQTKPGQAWPHAVAFHSSGVADVTHWDGNKLHVIEAKGGTSTLGGRDQEFFHQTTGGQQVAQDLRNAGAAQGNINKITKNPDGSWKTFQPGDRRGYINQYTTNYLPQGGDAYLTDIGHKMANSPATTTDGRQLLGQQILQHGANGSLHYVPVYTQAADGQGVSVMVGQKP